MGQRSKMLARLFDEVSPADVSPDGERMCHMVIIVDIYRNKKDWCTLVKLSGKGESSTHHRKVLQNCPLAQYS